MGYLVNDEASSRVKYNLGLNDCLKINLFCSRIVARQSATILTVLFSWAHTSWRKFHSYYSPFNKISNPAWLETKESKMTLNDPTVLYWAAGNKLGGTRAK